MLRIQNHKESMIELARRPVVYQSAFIFVLVIFFMIAFISLAYGLLTDLGFMPTWAKLFVVGIVGIVCMLAFAAIAFGAMFAQARRRR